MSETGRAGRYQRTTNGLIGAMVVTVIAVLAFVAFRGVTRDDVEVERPPIDYLGTVRDMQQAGRDVVYPASLPEGWDAVGVLWEPGERPLWGLDLHTEDGRYVGLRQQDESTDDLLGVYVDEDTATRDEVTVPGSVARSWDSYADEGGDHAYAAEVAGQTVLVFGTAPEGELEDVLGRLTRDPVRRP